MTVKSFLSKHLDGTKRDHAPAWRNYLSQGTYVLSFFGAALRASAPFIVAILVMAALGAAVIAADAALTAHNLFVNQTAPAQVWLGQVDLS